MMRQKQRKAVEELYGGKFDTPKSQVTSTNQNGSQKPANVVERDCGYIISSNTPYGAPPQLSAASNSGASKNQNHGKETFRRKTARHSSRLHNEKTIVKESHTMHGERNSPVLYDNKHYGHYKETPAEGVSQHHHHQRNHHSHRHNNHDEDKDDDTDEFFELIRRTVEGAIGKSISELLNRNFRELSTKVERFSAELKSTNAKLSQIQNELTNKIVHYGEENSRHFRYLCMKSEYDKMFYQHQTLIAAVKPPSPDITTESKNPEKRKSAPKLSKSSTKLQRNECTKSNAPTACPCSSARSKNASTEPKGSRKTSSEDVSQKSSEVGMREVLEHIQNFCNQMKMNESKYEQNLEGAGTSQQRNVMRHEDLIDINKEIFLEDDEDDDDWELSSDGMTPRNMEDSCEKIGGNTSRGGTTHRGNNGAGDG